MSAPIVRCGMPPFTTLIDARPRLTTRARRSGAVRLPLRTRQPCAGAKRSTRRRIIPGAQYLHLDRDLSSPITATSGRHPLPDPRRVRATARRARRGREMQIVAYDQGNGAYAARLWWLARWIGRRAVAVLDGGIAAWRAAGLPLETRCARPHRACRVRAGPRASLTARQSMQLRLRPGNAARRCARRGSFRGPQRNHRPGAGHIPGARNHAVHRQPRQRREFCPPSAAAALENAARLAPPSALIAMCGSGVTACHNLLALEHAGWGRTSVRRIVERMDTPSARPIATVRF